MSAYCTVHDLYDHGIPRGGVPNPARPAASINATTNTITLDGHGLQSGDPVSFRADVDVGGSMPAPLVAGTTYYAVPLNEFDFSVSATAGGSAIDLMTAGEAVLVIVASPTEAAIEWGAALLDDMMPAHVVPLAAPFPPIVVFTNAELAAGKLAARMGSTSKALSEIVDEARKRLARWGAGVPIRGTNAPPAASLSAGATLAPYADRRGWSRFGGL